MSLNTIPIGCLSEATICEYLRARGWVVTRATAFEWERPCEFSRRHGFSATWFSTIKKRKRLPPFEADKGRTGRVIWLRSNPQLEAFAERQRLAQKA